MATGPFYDTMPGPERRDTLNEMWAIWQGAIDNIIKGDKGWSPLLQGVIDGNRLVLQLYDWTGGEGDKPTQTGYLGVSGYVPNISDALDFRGPQGIQGLPGPSNSLEIGTVQSGTVADASITGSSPSQVLNLVLPKGDTGSPGNAATVEVGTVTTGNPGTSAQVTNTGSAQAAVLNFVIPRGEDGSGSGDMLKSEYDSVGDGVVNAARVAPWAGITGKPIVIAAGASQEDARAAISAVSSSELSTGLSNKVDKVAGKGLSTEDFTTTEKTKLLGIQEGAQVNTVTEVAGKTGSVLLNKNDVGLSDVDNTADSVKNVASAVKLTTGRSISTTGDADWTVSFDGSADSTAALTLTGTGVSAGTYPKVTVDTKGRVTNGAALVASDIPALNATKANVLGGTDDLYVSGGTYLNVISWNDMGNVSSNTSINLNTSLNHKLNATANITLDATNVNPGKTGDIVITTPSVRTVSWAAKWKFLGSVPNIGGAGETWVVSYKVFDANTIYASAVKVA